MQVKNDAVTEVSHSNNLYSTATVRNVDNDKKGDSKGNRRVMHEIKISRDVSRDKSFEGIPSISYHII